jgi:anthranilate phosphoribosyltransferase
MKQISIAEAIQRTVEHREVFHDEMLHVMRQIMRGELSPAQIAGFIIGLRVKKETIGEIAAAAQVMRELATPVEVADDRHLVDTCGTGGDAAHTFNISTCAAFVAAAAGAKVAKHMGRSVSSSSGSAEVLEALGANISLTPAQTGQALDKLGIGFMFAPAHHPAFRHIVPVRRALGVRTIFNLLGPLTNPAGVRRQVIGVSDAAYLDRLGEALATLGVDHALVVAALDGMDEISTSAPTDVVEITPDGLRRWRVDPAALGIEPPDEAAIAGGEPADNAAVMTGLLEGVPGAAGDLVALNAAAAIYVSGTVSSLEEGLEAARDSLVSGRAGERLAAFVAATGELAPVGVEG